MRAPFRHFVLLALLFVPATFADASIVTYSDRSLFQAATSGTSNVDFEGLAPAGGYFYAEASSFAGAEFRGPGGYLYVLDSGYGPTYDWGSGAVMYAGNGGSVTIFLPSGTKAIGADLMTRDPEAGLFSIVYILEDDTFGVIYSPTDVRPNRTFAGFVSTLAIKSVMITAVTGHTLIDNVILGDARASAVPEPSTLFGVVAGAIGAGATARRKRNR